MAKPLLFFTWLSSFLLAVLIIIGAWKYLQDPPLTGGRLGPLAYSEANPEAPFLEHGGECRLVHKATDKCAYVLANCSDEDSGLISYLQLYYCRLAEAKPIGLFIMVVWLGLLFSTIGIAASDFFCINLNTISTVLGLSESLAGVTFLAFGNGSPDVFSTFAAMNTHSGSLAVGELIGAASFITAIVSGSMAIVRPFKVVKNTFVRDISFFIVAASFSLIFLADGHLTILESAIMVLFYVLYVITVVAWHWVVRNKSRQRKREARARTQFSQDNTNDSERTEDDEDDEDRRIDGSPKINVPDMSEDFHILERAGGSEVGEEDRREDEAARQRWISAISHNMRLNRPVSTIRRSTGNPIRPSLVGALEFRAVLSSLEKSRSLKATPIHLRRYSDDPSLTLAQQQQPPSLSPNANAAQNSEGINLSERVEENMGNRQWRNRAASMNDATHMQPAVGSSWLKTPSQFSPNHSPTSGTSEIPSRSNSNTVVRGGSGSFQVARKPSPDRLNGNVSPGLLSAPGQTPSTNYITPMLSTGLEYGSVTANGVPTDSESSGQWDDRQPSRVMLLSPGTGGSSPVSPFPPFFDDPTFHPILSQPNSFRLPSPSLIPGSLELRSLNEDTIPKYLRWWPYSILPSPEVLFATLFPTLHSWKRKNIWERILGIIFSPSIFLLTITLPVVEVDRNDHPADKILSIPELADSPGATLNYNSHSSSISPPLIILDLPDEIQRIADGHTDCSQDRPPHNGGTDNSTPNDTTSVQQPSRSIQLERGSIELPNEDSIELTASSSKKWNRWLVSTQIFTGPLFLVTIIWATLSETHSKRQVLIAVSGALIGSLVVYTGILLKTSPNKIPRYRFLLCFLGFAVSITWISTIANEVVGLLKAFGVILEISDAILGLTVFAVGNSLGDLVADITVAKLGFPVMALSACFGGPMLNILLGIGISGLYVTIQESGKYNDENPGETNRYRPYELEVGGTLFVSGATLLVTLIGLLVAVPMNNWVMDRRIGWGLVSLWCVSTVINIVIEVTGISGNYS